MREGPLHTDPTKHGMYAPCPLDKKLASAQAKERWDRCIERYAIDVSTLQSHILLCLFLLSYTLGGFYLARYEDSPVGAFDEVGNEGKELGRGASSPRHWLPIHKLPENHLLHE